MRSVAVMLYLLLVACGCGDDCDKCDEYAYPEECSFADEGWFGMYTLDMEFEVYNFPYHGGTTELDAALAEIEFDGISGYFILRDEEENDYRFEVGTGVEKRLDRLKLGKTYHFVFWVAPVSSGKHNIYGIKILEGESLLFLAATYIASFPPAFPREPRGTYLEGDAFKGTEMEGLTYKQLRKSPCNPKEKESPSGLITLVTNLPVVFHYGEWSATLYQSQEVTLATSHGDFLIHVLHSIRKEPQNFHAEVDDGYSFYIKRL